MEPLFNTPSFYLPVAGVFAAIIGSFLNVVIYRLPKMLNHEWSTQCRELLEMDAGTSQAPPSLVRPRSHCVHCNTMLRVRDNIPLLSFLFLKGRCAHCHDRISWRYPLVEGLTVVLTVAVVWKFGFTAQAAAAALLVWVLIALSFIDLDHQILPDNITLPVLWLGLGMNTFNTFAGLQSAVIGAIAGYLFLWLVYHAFKLVTGKEGMGYGDFKLLAMLGAWLGWQFLPVIILLAAGAGAIIGITLIIVKGRDRHTPIPFGPYLSIAGYLALIWGDSIHSWYWGFTSF